MTLPAPSASLLLRKLIARRCRSAWFSARSVVFGFCFALASLSAAWAEVPTVPLAATPTATLASTATHALDRAFAAQPSSSEAAAVRRADASEAQDAHGAPTVTVTAPRINIEAAHPPELPRVEADGAPFAPTGRAYQLGIASWYGPRFHGRRTANGERFDRNAMTAAHRSLPFGTLVRVKVVRTGAELTVRINDRGPYVRGRIIDLSEAAARKLGVFGIASVELYLLPKK